MLPKALNIKEIEMKIFLARKMERCEDRGEVIERRIRALPAGNWLKQADRRTTDDAGKMEIISLPPDAVGSREKDNKVKVEQNENREYCKGYKQR
jgi:hypothetical protein